MKLGAIKYYFFIILFMTPIQRVAICHGSRIGKTKFFKQIFLVAESFFFLLLPPNEKNCNYCFFKTRKKNQGVKFYALIFPLF